MDMAVFDTEKKRKNKKFRVGGRKLAPKDLADVTDLLEGQSSERTYLIEHLHRIQDHFGGLKPAHLQALATHMKLSMAEVYEVATFYAHFHILADDTTPYPQKIVRVCNNTSCCMRGAESLLKELQKKYKDTNIHVEAAPCMGRCDQAPIVSVGKHYIHAANDDSVTKQIQSHEGLRAAPVTDFTTYIQNNGYKMLASCREENITREEILSRLEASGLRGMGGAGFPSFLKWKSVREQIADKKYLCINADEGEPGTFKDLHCITSSPHQMLEGILIASWFIDAEKAIIYLRDEYPECHIILRDAIDALEKNGWAEKGFIELRRGAGAYICGEESSMIESIEGKRGLPRHRPPYVAMKGLWNAPTMVHNVETLHWIPEILSKEKGWFASHGRNGRKGLRRFSVSGRVNQPGVKTAPAGITLTELIDEYCGGMEDGHKLAGYLPGGASGGILPASLADIPLDFDTLQPHGCFIGSAAIIVFSDKDDVKEIALNMMRFFAHESCGQCTPCRAGTEKAVTLMEREHWDLHILHELSQVMRDASICGLGQAAPNPLDCVIRYFEDSLS